jgi:HK97 family phage portal protein
MNWFTKGYDWMREKLNPAQDRIAYQEGVYIGSTQKITYQQAFQKLESVNRPVAMLVNACASLDYDVKDKVNEGVVTGIRQKTLNNLLNFKPNPYQSVQEFRQAIFMDLVLEGNVFVYFDGTFMYHLPAQNVQIITDPKTFISGYRYMGTIEFKETDIFHFRDLHSQSIYRGNSRLESAQRSIDVLYAMQDFQEKFFENGAIFGLVLTSDNTLSQVAKEKTIASWVQRYNAKAGGKRPVILDSGLKPVQVGQGTYKDLDFDESIKTHNNRIAVAVGVPPILLDGGNNANISPNLRLFYLETVMPIVRKFVSSLERYYGYDIDAVTANVSALQPDIKEIASYHATLVNGGIITPNEARKELRYEPIPGSDDLRVPANIAGSAADPSQGGKPPQPKE